jgi:23S rRNA (pseudouridine1915-N3)-methyltransferase
MNLRIIAAGKPALAYAKSGIEEYLRRLKPHGNVDLVIVKPGNREEVSARLLERSSGSFRIALDERGDLPDTRALAAQLNALELRGDVKCISFLIGAADGHSAELRDQCDRVISLSRLTLQHELALLVLLEQLYRLASLKSGSPYHRD